MPRLTARPSRVATRDTRRVTPPPKAADPFYLSRPWRDLVVKLIAQRGRRCEACGRTHDAKGKSVRLFGDHIRELRDGGAPLDSSNVRLLDGACHTAKTLAARAKRLRG